MRQDGNTSTALNCSDENWHGHDSRQRQGRRVEAVVAAALVAALGLGLAHGQVEYVDPSIGCVGHLLEPTRPTVSLPNSMVRVYPVRRDGTDDQISSFPLTIISHRLGELFW